MGIEDEFSGKKEDGLNSERILTARKNLLGDLNRILNVSLEKLEAYIFQAEKDRKIFEKIVDISHHWMLANTIDNSANDFIMSFYENFGDLNKDQRYMIADVHEMMQDYRDEILGKYPPMQTGNFEEFEIAVQRLRIAALVFKKNDIRRPVQLLEDLFLEDLAEHFSMDFDDLPSQLKMLLSEKSKEKFSKNTEVDDSVMESALKKFLTKLREENQKKETELLSRGVHPRITKRIMEKDAQDSRKAIGKLMDKLAGEEPVGKHFLKDLLAKYPDPRVIIREIIGKESNIP